jgi:GDP-L-fucose synthase
MPSNVYGPNDNYHPENSHFFAALILKTHNAKIQKESFVKIWGTGEPKRELLYVDDLADACVYFLNIKTKETLINIGSGYEKKIIDYAKFIIQKLNINLKIKFDYSKPDGFPRKVVDSSIAKKYGWEPKTNIEDGFKATYLDFLKHANN